MENRAERPRSDNGQLCVEKSGLRSTKQQRKIFEARGAMTSEIELAVPWDENCPGAKAVAQQRAAESGRGRDRCWVWPAQSIRGMSQRECG